MPLTQVLETSTSMDSSINATKIAVDYDGIDGGDSCNRDFDVIFQVTR